MDLLPTKDGYVKIKQIGKLKIGKNVEIGANCTIDRGAIDDTEIHDGVILDNLVHIAHNVILGQNSAIAASCAIAGSTKIGKNFQMGGLSGVLGHLDVCDNVTVGAHTLITKNIKNLETILVLCQLKSIMIGLNHQFSLKNLANKMQISKDDIKKYLPHREPFLFIDEVVNIDKNNEIHCKEDNYQ